MSEQRMTIIALGLSLLLTLFVLWLNFSLTLAMQLFTTGRVARGYFLALWGATGVIGGVIVWLWRTWRRSRSSQPHRTGRVRDHYDRREHLKRRTITLLEQQGALQFADIVQQTEVSELECQIILDGLIDQKIVRVVWQDEALLYCLVTEPLPL
jgi:membrane protein implicated in regulation of membrane protease activity